MKQINWLKLGIILVMAVAISLVLAYFIQGLIVKFDLSRFHNGFLVYLILFTTAIIVNLSFVPIPIAISLMIALSSEWNPVMVALVASLGACIGEMSGYFVGYMGKKVAIPDNIFAYNRIKGWVEKYGLWAIAFLSFQPVLPIEIGGMVAGAAKMPIRKFFPALWLGKFPKYLILIYLGDRLIKLLPF